MVHHFVENLLDHGNIDKVLCLVDELEEHRLRLVEFADEIGVGVDETFHQIVIGCREQRFDNFSLVVGMHLECHLGHQIVQFVDGQLGSGIDLVEMLDDRSLQHVGHGLPALIQEPPRQRQVRLFHVVVQRQVLVDVSTGHGDGRLQVRSSGEDVELESGDQHQARERVCKRQPPSKRLDLEEFPEVGLGQIDVIGELQLIGALVQAEVVRGE